jgi:hypothetical protein
MLERFDLRSKRSNVFGPTQLHSRNREARPAERLCVPVMLQHPARAHEDAHRNGGVIEVEREKSTHEPTLLLFPAMPRRRVVWTTFATPTGRQRAVEILGSAIFRCPSTCLDYEGDLALNPTNTRLDHGVDGLRLGTGAATNQDDRECPRKRE